MKLSLALLSTVLAININAATTNQGGSSKSKPYPAAHVNPNPIGNPNLDACGNKVSLKLPCNKNKQITGVVKPPGPVKPVGGSISKRQQPGQVLP